VALTTGMAQYICVPLIVHTENFIQRFLPNVTMLRPYRLVSFSFIFSKVADFKSVRAGYNIFGRDRWSGIRTPRCPFEISRKC
jgi:hypothetical protein